MAIVLSTGLQINGTDAVDTRLVVTKAEMLAMKGSKMPDNYICVCKDDGKLYIWNKMFDPDPVIGRFKPYEDIIEVSKAIDAALNNPTTKAQLEESISSTLPGAMTDALADPEKGQALVDAMFDSEHFEIGLDNKIDLAFDVIQAIDANGE